MKCSRKWSGRCVGGRWRRTWKRYAGVIVGGGSAVAAPVFDDSGASGVSSKAKVGFFYSATYSGNAATSRAVYNRRKWQLIGKIQWCCSANCGHSLHALTYNWTRGMQLGKWGGIQVRAVAMHISWRVWMVGSRGGGQSCNHLGWRGPPWPPVEPPLRLGPASDGSPTWLASTTGPGAGHRAPGGRASCLYDKAWLMSD